MAELAIPLAALGGLYLLNKKPEQSSVNEYNRGKKSSSTDRYYTKDNNQLMKHKNKKNKDKKFKSLTGENVKHKDLDHNNMQPFFGSNIKQMAIEQSHVLDNKVGSGTLNIKKKEIAPLFTPSENAHMVGGTPNSSDFIQSRIVGSKTHTDKGWQEIHVGPGIGEGYTTDSIGGFNNALNARDLYKDKTIDELRTKNNPKVSYRGGFGPAKNFINNRGIEGKVEKNNPDTAFEHGEKRMFGGVSDTKKNTMRSEQLTPCTQRETTSTEYYGGMQNINGDKEYVKGKYRESNKCKLDAYPILNPYNKDTFSHSDNNYNVDGYNVLNNNRSINKQQDSFLGAAASMIGEVTMPFKELLRPTKKENLLHNIKNSGNVKSNVNKSYYVDYKNKVKTTRKETTIRNKRDMMINGSHLYKVGNDVAKFQETPTIRSNTMREYKGIAGGNINNMTSNIAENNAYVNSGKEKTLKSRANQGNISLLNSDMNINYKNTDKTLDKRKNIVYYPNKTPSKNLIGEIITNKDSYSDMDRLNSDILKGLNSNPYAVYF